MHSRSCASLDAIARSAESAPHSPALIDSNGIALSYKDLWLRILAVGRRLDDAGLGFEDTVAVLLPQGARQVLAIAGVLNYCVCAPMHPRTTVAEVEHFLRALGAAAIVASPEFEAEAEAAFRMGLTVILAGDVETPDEWHIRRSSAQPRLAANRTDVVLLLITSATSGNSKLVPLTANNLDAQAEPRSRILRLTNSDRLLQMTSLSHSIGIDNTFAQFLSGGAIIATGGFDSNSYSRWLDELRPTWYDCSPTVHQAALAQLRVKPPAQPTSLRFVQSAGAPLPGEVRRELERILGVQVLNDYGMTETGPIATDAFMSGDRIPDSAGRSCGLEIVIMDSTGELVATDTEGEIAVRGPAVFAGYLDNPEANHAAFRNGWFCTGDLGHLDQAGNLFVTGRLKEMINRGGEKILPGEIDLVLASHPAVLDAAAFGVPHPTLGEDVACAVVLRPAAGLPVTTTELRRFAAERLASFKIPRRICIVDQIPRGEQGKPQRWLLTERLSEKHAPPPSPIEVSVRKLTDDVDDIFYKLHEIWARILDRNDLGFDEDFFNAGGDSLAAISMLAEVDQRFSSQASESAASFFDEPTLLHLTRLVGNPRLPRPSKNETSDIRVFPVRESDSGQRLWCVPADGDEGLYFRRLATHLRGQMDLSIARPMNTFYSRALFTFERAGSEMAAVIRQSQPEGPYILCGFCYGGIVAVEAARQLILTGQHVRLILFDTPTPGSPAPATYVRFLIGSAWNKWKIIRKGGQFERSTNPSLIPRELSGPEGNRNFLARGLAWFALNLRATLRRFAWSAALPFRRLLVPFENSTGIRKFMKWAQADYFPFYRPRPIDAPILHILCSDEPEQIDVVTRFGWRKMASRGIDERFVPLDHNNLLHESNLPGIVGMLLEWSNTSIDKSDK
jgi:acyl-CoA synthetase (AMP-forming)/AMP-acid ligase II/thioesterase domain-containing protein